MNIQAFFDSIPIMGMGMFGIFVVTAIIIGIIYILNKVAK